MEVEVMEEKEIIFMFISKCFRKNNKTSWGKLEILKEIDKIEERYNNINVEQGNFFPKYSFNDAGYDDENKEV